MARLVAALTLALVAACGAADRGPAWPKRLDPEVDGGESLAPRTPSVIASSDDKNDQKEKDAETSDDSPDKKTDEIKDADKPAEAKPAATITIDDDVIIIDDIVIEIED